jgi:16S rRNA (adenine1518-N6/adenine1519-N6)-dimethyltransferase
MDERRTSAALGPAEVRRLCAELGIVPSKRRGQNFVHDANTVRRVVAAAGVQPDDVVLEVGPGLGSLTLPLLDAARQVVAVEVDARLAQALPGTVERLAGADAAARLVVLAADALRLVGDDLVTAGAARPTCLVANLPYNVAVPVLLHMLAELPSVHSALVMVQAEVADRLTAGPGSRTYGSPSVKVAWYGRAEPAGSVPRTVFWPVPNVDSSLVRVTRTDPPATDVPREQVFAVIDAAFAQRRKSLRAALSRWAGSPSAAEQALRAAGVDPSTRGERLAVDDFARIAAAHPGV